MKNFKDPPLSPSADKDDSSSTSFCDGGGSSKYTTTDSKYEALMDQLQTTTNDFMTAICTTKRLAAKNVFSRAGKVHVKPLCAAAYGKIDSFIASIDSIIKWHEAKDKQNQVTINSLLDGIALTAEETDKKMKEMQQCIFEQHDKIDQLKPALSAAEDEKKDALVKVADLNEENESLKDRLNNAEYELVALNSIVAGRDANIQYWKQKYEESYHSSRAQSGELNQKIADLEVTLQTTLQQDAHEIEASKDTVADLEKQLSASSHDFSAKVKALENENNELKQKVARLEAQLQESSQSHVCAQDEMMKFVFDTKTKQPSDASLSPNEKIKALENGSSVLRENLTTTSNEDNKFIELKDVIVNGQINYELLKDKILVVDTLKPYGSYCSTEYNDGTEVKLFNLQLNGTFKLHINGGISRGDFFLKYNHDDTCEKLCKHIHSCALKSLCAGSGDLCFNDFLKLVGSGTIESLDIRSDVRGPHSRHLPLEGMFKYFPNLKYFKMGSCSRQFTRKEASTFLKLPIFKNLETFQLYGCPDHFDLIVYNEFMKKYPDVNFRITFDQHPRRDPVLLEKLYNDKNRILRSWPGNSSKLFIEIEKKERYY